MWKLSQLAPLQKGFLPDPCWANSGCIAWPGKLGGNRPGWLVAGPGQVGNRQNQPRIKFIVRNWPETSRALVKYPGESLGLKIYTKPMRAIQKFISEPIRVIPNKLEASFNPYQSEAHLKSIRTLNLNQSKLSIRMNPKFTGFIRIEISNSSGLIYRIGFGLIRIENLLWSHSE